MFSREKVTLLHISTIIICTHVIFFFSSREPCLITSDHGPRLSPMPFTVSHFCLPQFFILPCGITEYFFYRVTTRYDMSGFGSSTVVASIYFVSLQKRCADIIERIFFFSLATLGESEKWRIKKYLFAAAAAAEP